MNEKAFKTLEYNKIDRSSDRAGGIPEGEGTLPLLKTND